MVRIKINNKDVDVGAGTTVIQACEIAGVDIPRFCYHEKLAIAGNCRMCLVEIEGGPPKPVASCATIVAEGMSIRTDTKMVEQARKGAMEFLLLNHPLDCPICDQGGECELQDQAFAYGSGYSRYEYNKRAVSEKNMGPMIKTNMTRCIHCSRCIRFMDDIAGTHELIMTGRGEDAEIVCPSGKLTSELSGNIIDLCPVGALTSAPGAFRARSWELTRTRSIDVTDATGGSIVIESKGDRVMRITPFRNDDINETWMSDRCRFSCDGLSNQRLDKPYIRKDETFEEVSWKEVLEFTAKKIRSFRGSQIAAIVGDMVDCESMVMLNRIFKQIGCEKVECRSDGSFLPGDNRSAWRMNVKIADIEKADVCLMIGVNPMQEAPLINARLRKAYLENNMQAFYIGEIINFNYPITHLGDHPGIISDLLLNGGKIAELLRNAKNPLIIMGCGVLQREDARAVLSQLMQIAEKYNVVREGWIGFNVLPMAASRVGGMELGLFAEDGVRNIQRSASSGEIKLVYLLGADELDMSDFGNAFIIYQGHHGDSGAYRANVILPGASYAEKDGWYVNAEGRPQLARRAVFSPGNAKDDREILALLAEHLCLNNPINTPNDLYSARRLAMEQSKTFELFDIVPVEWKVEEAGACTIDLSVPIRSARINFHTSNSISRASVAMEKRASSVR